MKISTIPLIVSIAVTTSVHADELETAKERVDYCKQRVTEGTQESLSNCLDELMQYDTSE